MMQSGVGILFDQQDGVPSLGSRSIASKIVHYQRRQTQRRFIKQEQPWSTSWRGPLPTFAVRHQTAFPLSVFAFLESRKHLKTLAMSPAICPRFSEEAHIQVFAN
jgi:hypothetical protein